MLRITHAGATRYAVRHLVGLVTAGQLDEAKRKLQALAKADLVVVALCLRDQLSLPQASDLIVAVTGRDKLQPGSKLLELASAQLVADGADA